MNHKDRYSKVLSSYIQVHVLLKTPVFYLCKYIYKVQCRNQLSILYRPRPRPNRKTVGTVRIPRGHSDEYFSSFLLFATTFLQPYLLNISPRPFGLRRTCSFFSALKRIFQSKSSDIKCAISLHTRRCAIEFLEGASHCRWMDIYFRSPLVSPSFSTSHICKTDLGIQRSNFQNTIVVWSCTPITL